MLDCYLPCVSAFAKGRLYFSSLKGQEKNKQNNLKRAMGWLMGLEPTTTGITILDSTN